MSQDAGPGDAASLAAAAVGARVVDSIMGDLTGEGWDDALLVIAVASAAHSGAHQTLEIALIRRDATGRLRKVATNARLLTCGPYGAVSGYLRAEPSAFTVVDQGSDGGTVAEYRFVYDKRSREWFAASLVRCVADAVTGRTDRQELTVGDFGRVSFERFDPVRLPSL